MAFNLYTKKIINLEETCKKKKTCLGDKLFSCFLELKIWGLFSVKEVREQHRVSVERQAAGMRSVFAE